MLSSKFIADHLDNYGEVVLQCAVYISRSIRDRDNQQVLHCACALLNSGGGLLHMRNVDHAGKVQSKDLDTWWSGMESNLADILSGDDLCNYFDFVGNFDDRDLFLFVKSAEHLCTLIYHCRLPTDTATHNVTYTSATKLLARQGEPCPLGELPVVPGEYHYGQVEDSLKQEGKQIQFKLLATNREQGKSLADRIRPYCIKYISAFANHYGGHVYFGIEDATAAVFGELVDTSMEKKIIHQVQRMMRDMIWGDPTVQVEQGKHWDVLFCPVTHCPRLERRRVVVVSVCKFPGGVFTACPESYVVGSKGNVEPLDFGQWKAEVLNQSRVRPDLQTRFVKVGLQTPFSPLLYSLSHTLHTARDKVLKLCAGFNLQPQNYLHTLSDPHLLTCVRRLLATFAEEPHLAIPLQCWGTRLSAPAYDDLLSSLLVVSRLYGLHLVLLVTSYLNSAELWVLAKVMATDLKHRLVQQGGCVERLAINMHVVSVADPLMVQNFQVSIDSSIYPPTFALSEQKMDHILTALLISIASYSPCRQSHTSCSPAGPGAQPGQEENQFLLTCDQLELLWTRQFTKQLWVHGPPGAGKTVAALEMIRELGARGCQRSQVLYLAENPLLCAYISSFGLCQVASRRELMEDVATPQIFTAKYRDVRNVIVDEAQNFKDRDGDWYSVAEQLASQGADSTADSTAGSTADSTADSTAGTGSERDLKIHRDVSDGGDASASTAAPVCSRREDTSSNSDRSTTKSHTVSGSPPKRPRSCSASLTSGYFWVFMDYAQKVHKFRAGLPGLIGENNFMLSEISRNSKEIFDYAMKFMSKPSGGREEEGGGECVKDAPQLGHQYERGKGVEVVKCSKESVHRTLFTVLESYLGSGMKADDIAILVSKRREKEEVEKEVKQDLGHTGLEKVTTKPPSAAAVTVDTVRDFSGLDKPVVIGLEPHTDDRHANLDKFIVNLATRARDGLVIITTSDELMKKLQIQ